MKDYFGQPLALGDRVAFIETGYRNLKKATIIAMTPQKVRLRFPSPFRDAEDHETLRYPSEVIKG